MDLGGLQMNMTGVGARPFRMIAAVAVAGIAFQAVHFVEHIAQALYWVAHPTAPPWLTPWAVAGRDVLVVDGTAGSGAELLHLVGNGIFLAALFALCVLAACKATTVREFRGLRPAIMWQSFHVMEHIALTGTYLLFGKAMGVSTLFGLVGAGPLMWSYRVWFHFAINLVATVYAVRAMGEMHRRQGLYHGLELLPAT